MRLVRKCKPDTITISEAKVSAIRNPNSAFSRFASRLAALGYEIEEIEVFENDQAAQQLIDLYQEYYEQIQRKLVVKHARNGDASGEVSRRTPEEVEATKEFFKRKGFQV